MSEEKEDQAVSFALGLLSPEEARRVAAQARVDEELDALIVETEEAAASLVHALPVTQAPPEVLTRLLASVRGESPAPPAPSSRRSITSPAPARSWAPWAAAAAVALAAGAWVYQANDGKSALAEQARRAEVSLQAALNERAEEAAKFAAEKQALAQRAEEISRAQERLLSERSALQKMVAELQNRDALSQLRIATLKSQVETFSRVAAVAVWDAEKQTGVVRIDGLPTPSADQDYQLWVIDPKAPGPISAGLVYVGSGGVTRTTFKPNRPVSSADKFAVSLERRGGSPTARGPIVLLSN